MIKTQLFYAYVALTLFVCVSNIGLYQLYRIDMLNNHYQP